MSLFHNGRRALTTSALGSTYTLVLARDASTADRAAALRPAAAVQACASLFSPWSDDVFIRAAVLPLLRDAGDGLYAAADLPTAELLDRVHRLIETGALLAIPTAPPVHDNMAQPGIPKPDAAVALAGAISEAPEEHAWLELEVVDDAGQPCTGATVRVLHEGAVVATRTVGEAPLLRFDGLPEADRYDVEVDPPRRAA